MRHNLTDEQIFSIIDKISFIVKNRGKDESVIDPLGNSGSLISGFKDKEIHITTCPVEACGFRGPYEVYVRRGRWLFRKEILVFQCDEYDYWDSLRKQLSIERVPIADHVKSFRPGQWQDHLNKVYNETVAMVEEQERLKWIPVTDSEME